LKGTLARPIIIENSTIKMETVEKRIAVKPEDMNLPPKFSRKYGK